MSRGRLKNLSDEDVTELVAELMEDDVAAQKAFSELLRTEDWARFQARIEQIRESTVEFLNEEGPESMDDCDEHEMGGIGA